MATIGWHLPPLLPLQSSFLYGNIFAIVKFSSAAEDGKFVGDPDVGEFWSLFGGYAPIPKDSPSSFENQSNSSSVKLFW